MNFDFSLKPYYKLLTTLFNNEYNFYTFSSYLTNNFSLFTDNSLLAILRHDVDRIPQNSLRTAQIEHSLGIKGSYYFRVVPESYDLDIMIKIAELGHEIGYHYEDVDLVLKSSKQLRVMSNESKLKGDENGIKSAHSLQFTDHLIDLAYESFCKNLEMFRKNFDIKTICMHGSPRSKYDNKIIWSHRDANGKQYNYKDLGIIGEPYYDIDFNEFAYFTDTGRRWNGERFSIRDKVNSKYNFNFKSTQDIINNIEKLPNKVMFTIHPERWHNSTIPWVKELVWQNFKNVVKRVVVKKRVNSEQ